LPRPAFHRKAVLLLAAGLLIHISSISAQDIQEALPVVEDRLRAAEQTMIINESTDVAVQTTGPSIWAAVRMVLVLALVAAAVYGVVFFLKRTSKPSATSDPFLKILASSHLGSNRYAHVVSVGNRAWLMGSSDGGVNLIAEIVDKDVLDEMLLKDSKKTSETQMGRFPDFVSMLRKLGTPVESRTANTDDIRERRERLKGL
jgi:flagellar protein FliO/FliZ